MSGAKAAWAMLLILGAGVPAFACEHPALPLIPEDGKLKSREQRAVNLDVIRYITGMGAYVGCIEAAHRAATRDGVHPVNLQLLALRNNAAVAEIEAVKDIYVANVGPFEELFFEQPYDGRDRSGYAAKRPPPAPRGPERALRRIERMEGDCGTSLDCTFDKSFARPGAAR